MLSSNLPQEKTLKCSHHTTIHLASSPIRINALGSAKTLPAYSKPFYNLSFLFHAILLF
jgi:hypothetical protein